MWLVEVPVGTSCWTKDNPPKWICPRGPVDHTVVRSWNGCKGFQDGTRCIKKCKKYSCKKDYARCFKVGNAHPRHSPKQPQLKLGVTK